MYSIILNVLSFAIEYLLIDILLFNVTSHMALKAINKCKGKINEANVQYMYMLSDVNYIFDYINKNSNKYKILEDIKIYLKKIALSYKIFTEYYHGTIEIYDENNSERVISGINRRLEHANRKNVFIYFNILKINRYIGNNMECIFTYRRMIKYIKTYAIDEVIFIKKYFTIMSIIIADLKAHDEFTGDYGEIISTMNDISNILYHRQKEFWISSINDEA